MQPFSCLSRGKEIGAKKAGAKDRAGLSVSEGFSRGSYMQLAM
jgi:hypothetical protein